MQSKRFGNVDVNLSPVSGNILQHICKHPHSIATVIIAKELRQRRTQIQSMKTEKQQTIRPNRDDFIGVPLSHNNRSKSFAHATYKYLI